jgi:hypothetical protein
MCSTRVPQPGNRKGERDWGFLIQHPTVHQEGVTETVVMETLDENEACA